MNSRKYSPNFNATFAVSLALCGLAIATSAQAAAYPVRTAGSAASQCTGLVDTTNSGTAQGCARKNPNIALPPSGSKRIAGGATLFLGSGRYQIGAGGQLQSISSGTASTPAFTKILGQPGTVHEAVGSTSYAIK